MTIDELISELQRVKDTYGDMEVRVIATSPIDYSKVRDERSLYPFIWSASFTLDKNDFVVTDRTPEGPDLFAHDNTRYLSLGDFSNGLSCSDLRDIADKYHSFCCARCNLLH